MGYFITKFTGYSSSNFVSNSETASIGDHTLYKMDNKTTHSLFSWLYQMTNNTAM
jgi:hypothetical protein